eukprot:3616915-Rhodomonas_salina.1
MECKTFPGHGFVESVQAVGVSMPYGREVLGSVACRWVLPLVWCGSKAFLPRFIPGFVFVSRTGVGLGV